MMKKRGETFDICMVRCTNYLTVTGFGNNWNISDIDGRKAKDNGWPAACHVVGKIF